MNKYRYIYFIWFLPLYFVWMGIYQIRVYNGIGDTFVHGEDYEAEVVDFEVKQIAAQSNGFIVLQFTTNTNEVIREQLALSIQMAQVSMSGSDMIPVRYKPDSFRTIVIVPVYELQRDMIRVNLAVMGICLLITVIIAGWATRYANRKVRDGDEEVIIERIDTIDGDE